MGATDAIATAASTTGIRIGGRRGTWISAHVLQRLG